MRVLHTSDWHLGRRLHGFSLLDHQAIVLDALVDAVREERIDVVLLSGDVYDRSVPPLEAVALCSETLARMRAAGAVVVVISGNHDSATRLGFGREVLAEAGVHVATDIARAGQPVIVASADGEPVAIYPIPYLEPEAARHALDKPEARTHDALLRAALARCRRDLDSRPGLRSIAVAHAFVTGGAESSSEKQLVVGGSAEVGLGAFRSFDYVALGHLHGRQTFGDGRVRYAGSPLAYAFDEAAHVKGAWIVDLAADGTRTVAPLDLPVPRAMAEVHGTVDSLVADPAAAGAEACWVRAVVTDAVLPADAMGRLRQRFPHLATVDHRPATRSVGGAPARDRVHGRDDLDLVGAFVAHVTGSAPDRADLDLAAAALGAAAAEAAA